MPTTLLVEFWLLGASAAGAAAPDTTLTPAAKRVGLAPDPKRLALTPPARRTTITPTR